MNKNLWEPVALAVVLFVVGLGGAYFIIAIST